jgi:hypothetical protein
MTGTTEIGHLLKINFYTASPAAKLILIVEPAGGDIAFEGMRHPALN